MHPNFSRVVDSLDHSFEQLMGMEPVVNALFPKVPPKQGVYLFSEDGRHLYVGRSNSIRDRYGNHCNPSATAGQAAFAFKLARETAGRTKPSYKRGDESREGLMRDPEFTDAFSKAKKKIRAMEFRYVEETDQLRQALLEIYCAVAHGTPYNDFNTH